MKLSIVLLLCFIASANAASFNCTRASTLVEQAICSDAKLSKLDDALAQAYKSAMVSRRNAATLKSEQHAWLTDVRNKCADVTCLNQAYTERLNELNALSDKKAPAIMNKDAPKQITVRGIIRVGTLDSEIEDEDSNGATFLTRSQIGDKIFAVCQSDDLCEVTGNVVGEYSQFISVTNVKLLKKAR